MNRIAFAPAVALLCSLILASNAFAQAKATQAPATKAAPAAAAQAPAARAKFVRPIKGVANIEFMQGTPKKIGGDIVTVLKIRNVSSGAISLLKVDEYWYNKKREVATGDSQPYRKPFLPGEIIEITMRSPFKPDLYQSQYQFSHAYGGIDVKRVKKFE